jgi:hypothetical protein
MPVHAAVSLHGDVDAGFRILVRYRLLGLVRGARVLRTSVRRGARSASEASAPTSAATSRPRGSARARRLVWHLDLGVQVLRRGAVRLERPSGSIEFALGDPAQTGEAYGAALAVASLADPDGALRLVPLWTVEDWLAADVTLAARIQPLRLALVLAGRWLRERTRGAHRPAEPHPHAA